jgi:D-alanyl-D-alanine carboxypeptidase
MGFAPPATIAAPQPAPSAGSAEPIRPVAVRTVAVKPPSKKGPKAPPAAQQHEPEAPATTARAETPAPAPARAGFLGVLPARTASVSEPPPAPARAEPVRDVAPQRETPPQQRETPPQREAALQREAAPSSRPQTRSGWVIQVGAYPAESEAHQRLALVKNKASRLLASASPFTESVQRGETTLYRARFAGLEREQAEAACKFLKRNDVDCLAIKN